MSADVWSLVESGKPELIDKWEIPARWRVKYSPCATFEGMKNWAVLAPGAVIPAARFPTWREAMDCADERARTREVLLPRAITVPHNPGAAEWDFSEWAGLSYTPAWPESAFYDRRGGPIGRHFTGDVSIRRDHWKPLALALLALAEQENA